jgi:hypothetical protein
MFDLWNTNTLTLYNQDISNSRSVRAS